jgi:hypothetical protein
LERQRKERLLQKIKPLAPVKANDDAESAVIKEVRLGFLERIIRLRIDDGRTVVSRNYF